MWHALQQLAFPSRLYRFCSAFIPWLSIASLILLATGLTRGFIFAPANPLQGQSYRILYLNIPATIASSGMYLAMTAAALLGLIRGRPTAFLTVAAIAPVGALFAFISLATGIAWAQFSAAGRWAWSDGLTSELMLIILYSGVICLWRAGGEPHRAGRIAAVVTLIGAVNLPFIHHSLLAGTKWLLRGFSPAMHDPLHLTVTGFLLLFTALVMMRLRNLILAAEQRRPWVSELCLKRG